MEIVKSLINFAVRLDEEHLQPTASVVDAVAENLVKTAQYVGSQGYWVRNERCWSNCYRQKRASSPSKPAQEVWFDCQQEFEESINNDGSSWDKYAGSDVLIKTAARDALDSTLAAIINDQFQRGIVPATSVQTVSTESKHIISKAYLDAATSLLRIAEDLSEFDDDLSFEANEISEALTKEAQSIWQNTRDFGKSVGQGLGDAWNNPAGKNSPGAGQGLMGRFRANQMNTRDKNFNYQKAKYEADKKQYNQRYNPGAGAGGTPPATPPGSGTAPAGGTPPASPTAGGGPTGGSSTPPYPLTPGGATPAPTPGTPAPTLTPKPSGSPAGSAGGSSTATAPAATAAPATAPATSTAPTTAPASTSTSPTAPTAAPAAPAAPAAAQPQQAAQKATSAVTTLMSQLKNELGNLGVSKLDQKGQEEAHDSVVKALQQQQFDDPKAAGHIANWLLGTNVAIASSKKKTLFKI